MLNLLTKSKVINGIGYSICFLLGAILASYYPLPGISMSETHYQCPELIKCPVGFATLEEMSFLVEELESCNGEANEDR